MSSTESRPPETRRKRGLALLSLGALGIVFGDIGTSPLYAVRECFSGRIMLPVTPDNVLGTVSIVFWALIIVVTLNYIVFIMRFDNKGEGGILALMSLVGQGFKKQGDEKSRESFIGKSLILLLGILGASLLFGDALITPAVSVLSAVEGLSVAAPELHPFVIPIAITILVMLFLIQKGGTARIGSLFGPVMLVWFLVLASLGLYSISQETGILKALNPLWAIRLFHFDLKLAMKLLGTVFLTVTGAEVLYADMGHFGKFPIRFAWFTLVLPSLTLNYFGQGALLLRLGTAPGNLFYSLVPPSWIIPLVCIATCATVIASQAVISGIFSLIRQAIALGFWPRLKIIHTSVSKEGQIYIPAFNFILLAGTLSLVLYFKSSGKLADAYGIAVSSSMAIDAILMLVISLAAWKRMWLVALLCLLVFLPVNLAFMSANLVKLAAGGWIIVLLAAIAFLLMTTWRSGREQVRRQMEALTIDIKLFMDDMEKTEPSRVKGTGIFLSGHPRGLPRSLLQNYMHNKVLHDTTIILTVKVENVPKVADTERFEVEPCGQGIYRVRVSFGFSETPDVPEALENLRFPGLEIQPADTVYFIDKIVYHLGHSRGMWSWRKRIFNYLASNALDASLYFHLPPEKVIEMGMQADI